MKTEYFKVYYRCKAGGNGTAYAVKVSGTGRKKLAIVATHIYMSDRDRSGYYAPIAYKITEQEFLEHPRFNEGREHIRW